MSRAIAFASWTIPELTSALATREWPRAATGGRGLGHEWDCRDRRAGMREMDERREDKADHRPGDFGASMARYGHECGHTCQHRRIDSRIRGAFDAG